VKQAAPVRVAGTGRGDHPRPAGCRLCRRCLRVDRKGSLHFRDEVESIFITLDATWCRFSLECLHAGLDLICGPAEKRSHGIEQRLHASNANLGFFFLYRRYEAKDYFRFIGILVLHGRIQGRLQLVEICVEVCEGFWRHALRLGCFNILDQFRNGFFVGDIEIPNFREPGVDESLNASSYLP